MARRIALRQLQAMHPVHERLEKKLLMDDETRQLVHKAYEALFALRVHTHYLPVGSGVGIPHR